MRREPGSPPGNWRLSLDRGDEHPTAVGTHPDHRRRGLARAVRTAGLHAFVLHAFARAGGRRAVVRSRGDAAHPVPTRLYESVGFTPYTRTHTFVGGPTG
ncbi:hypothetical protein ABZW10_18320 [Kitasatospora sp. NPDC004723]|uniref:GNAT family N-acetyltransferase n=1 Tax=Kitasatospora sp. NPDC004723 TaxID=3154288 RepID=UPI0033BCD40B